jgi:hypothetical protein
VRIEIHGRDLPGRDCWLMLGPDLIAAAAGGTLTGELALTAADGTPRCAAVRAPAIEWTIRPG